MWNGTVTPSLLRSNIERLHSLDRFPRSPAENKTAASTQGDHQLPFARDTEIAINLAFISGATDNNLKVMAVCIEEDANRDDSITVRLACNTGDLSAMEANFRDVAKGLEIAATRGQSFSVAV